MAEFWEGANHFFELHTDTEMHSPWSDLVQTPPFTPGLTCHNALTRLKGTVGPAVFSRIDYSLQGFSVSLIDRCRGEKMTLGKH